MIEKTQTYISPRWIVCLFLLAAALCSRAEADAGKFTGTINLVFDNGSVMIYKGSGTGLAVSDVYNVSEEGRVIARIELEKVESYYSLGRVVSSEKPLREGASYEFRNAAAGETAEEDSTKRKRKTDAEEGETGKKEEAAPAEEKERAKKSKRREKVAGEEEGAAATEKPGEDAEKKKTETKKDETKKDETADKKKKKPEDKMPLKGSPSVYPTSSPSSLGYAATGLSGSLLFPTARNVPKSRARLGFSYFDLSGSEYYYVTGATGVSTWNLDMKLQKKGFYFAYGINDHLEASISSTEVRGHELHELYATSTTFYNFTYPYDQKHTAFSLKYHLKGERVHSKSNSFMDFEVALLASVERGHDMYSNESETYIYGLAGAFPITDRVTLNSMYADVDVKDKVAGVKANSDPIFGIGIEARSKKRMKYYLEFLKFNKDERFKTFGLRYTLNKNYTFDLAWLRYEKDFEMENAKEFELKADSLFFGANYSF